ncbi:MAG: MCE family protein [Candidatus Dormibacteraeota bacterium]|nr:MCE family protein [Candidatus Dormibacteraeota bacterium]
MSGTGRRGGFNPLIAGFIASAVIVLLLGTLVKINLDLAAPWASTHTMTAQVTDVDGISSGSDVRIAGRAVGQVTSVTAQGNYSTVTFHLDNSNWPLPGDTSASIRLATLLGQKYLQLSPGSDWAHTFSDNAVIALKATKPVVDFDQILNTFNKPTRDALTSLVRTAATAVKGQEGTLQQLIPDLRDLSVHSVAPTGELVKRNADINNILVNLGTTADQLNQSGNDLVGVIDNMNTITGALASNQGALEGYIANTDALNLNTNAVLSGGKDAAFNAGLKLLAPFTTQLDQLMTTLVPETFHFATDTSPSTHQHIYQDALNLVFEIGPATAQSDRSGFFLRQYANGVDPCGLIGPTCVATTLPVAPPIPGGTGGLPCLPPLPCITLPSGPGLPALNLPVRPSLPAIPTLPAVPTLPPILATPTPLPTPTALPLPCVPGITCGQQASYETATPLARWGWL